jgi:hypothetical protein
MSFETAGEGVMPPTELTGRIALEPKKNRRMRLRESNFLILVNPNAPSDDPAFNKRLAARLEGGIKKLSANLGEYMWCRPDCWADGRRIVKVAMKYTIEKGSEQELSKNVKLAGRVHAHITLEIDHTTMIRLNLKALRSLFTECCELQGRQLFLNVKTFKSGRNVHRYVEKDWPDSDEEGDLGEEAVGNA